MTAFTAANYLSNAGRTEAEMKQAFEDNLAATKQLLGGVAQSTLTLSSDTITPTGGFHLVDTQAAAATDDLSTIAQTNLPDGSFVMLGLANAAHNVVLKHNVGGTGKLSLVGGVDVTLDLTTSFVLFQRNGTVWEERWRFYGTDSASFRAFYGVPGLAGTNTFTGRQHWAKGADIASGATLTPGTDGNYFHVTGTTGVTAIASLAQGTRVLFEFDAALTITHNATSLILPRGEAITTQIGDVLEFVSEGSGNWRLISRTSGTGVPDFSQFVLLQEDFQVILDTNPLSVGGAVRLASGYWGAGPAVNWTSVVNSRGIVRIVGDGASTQDLYGPHLDVSLAAPIGIVTAADSPTLQFRAANVGASGTTRRLGATGTIFNNTNPSNGIFVRWDPSGNYIFVTRSGGTETTTDTTIAANATFRRFKVVIATGLAVLFVDGVQRASHATNVPAAGLFLDAGSPLNSGHGIDLDYFNVTYSR